MYTLGYESRLTGPSCHPLAPVIWKRWQDENIFLIPIELGVRVFAAHGLYLAGCPGILIATWVYRWLTFHASEIMPSAIDVLRDNCLTVILKVFGAANQTAVARLLGWSLISFCCFYKRMLLYTTFIHCTCWQTFCSNQNIQKLVIHFMGSYTEPTEQELPSPAVV